MLLLFAHALASDRTDCHDGDLPACERVLGLEAGRLIASGDDGVPDVRLTTSFAVVAERACELGNAGACSYLQRTPPELPTPLDPRVRRFDGLGVPLPGARGSPFVKESSGPRGAGSLEPSMRPWWETPSCCRGPPDGSWSTGRACANRPWRLPPPEPACAPSTSTPEPASGTQPPTVACERAR